MYKYAECFHCHKTFVQTLGNTCCNVCRRKGHNLDYNKCRICAGKEPEGKDSLANIDQIISMMPKRYG